VGGCTPGSGPERRRRPCTQSSGHTRATLADTLAEHTDEIRQVIGGIEGFKAYYLVKLGEGTTTISVFEDQAGAEQSVRAAAAWLAENLPDLEVAAPYVTAGDVLIEL
jgi:hypothetical protein